MQTVKQNYSLSQCGTLTNTKYFSTDGFNVGTQLYNTTGLQPGFYLYRGSLDSPTDILSYYLDPINTAYSIPNDWYIVEIEAFSSGTSNRRIASITQYNSISCI